MSTARGAGLLAAWLRKNPLNLIEVILAQGSWCPVAVMPFLASDGFCSRALAHLPNICG
jgi:hypothetical protein